MSTNNFYRKDQLDILDEAINLVNAAESRGCDITLADALEIMKILQLDRIEGRVNVVANAIHEKY